MSESETLAEELRRLVNAYRNGEGEGEGTEAWHLIADCVVENIDRIVSALSGEEGK